MEVSMKPRIAVAGLGSVFAFRVVGCASVKTVEATGGSRSDGTVELSYQVFATATNKSGGEMLITSAGCDEKGFVIITSNPGGGDSLHGCLSKLPPGRFYVRWDDGDTSVLSQSAFTRLDQ
jgi:hypothetical protein